MYSWSEDTSDWLGAAGYKYSSRGRDRREKAAARARSGGPRRYEVGRTPPNPKLIDPSKHPHSDSKTPIVVAVDVTGSMASWPFEIFDRLPLFYNTLSQYREDLEVCFAAIGDASVDRFPLQVTDFASGYDLEQQLKMLYGEGGGGDAPESYGLFAWWMLHHVRVPKAPNPILIVFGDAPMHQRVPVKQIDELLGGGAQSDADSIECWRELAKQWNVWFLRRPTGRPNDEVDRQWRLALGRYHVVRIQEEQRAVDYAMGIVARSWGHFDDFRKNMLARQPEAAVKSLAKHLDDVKVRTLSCPECAAPVPPGAYGHFSCEYCSATLTL